MSLIKEITIEPHFQINSSSKEFVCGTAGLYRTIRYMDLDMPAKILSSSGSLPGILVEEGMSKKKEELMGIYSFL